MLTLQKLKDMNPGDIFAIGTFKDDPSGCNIGGTGEEVQWIAKRGGIHDWAIYCQNPHYIAEQGQWTIEKIARVGDKIIFEKNIRKLVPCDDEAFEMYRY